MPILLNWMDKLHKNKQFERKILTDNIVKNILFVVTILCASVIVFIVFFILLKGISPFINGYEINGKIYTVDIFKFIFGTTWFKTPNLYGVGFIIANTVYVVSLTLILAVPISVLTALFITRIAPDKVGKSISYIIELLASIPSIIYGLFGLGVITTVVKNLSNFFGYQSAGGISTLSSAIVLAIMIIPTITMIASTSIKAVSQDLINASLALGASPTQTNFKMVLKSARSGIFSGIILGVGRALGEATAISMVAGNSGNGPTFNFFDTTRTLTTTMLLGLKETTGLDYDIRFSVGIVLIVIIIGRNILLNFFNRKLEK